MSLGRCMLLALLLACQTPPFFVPDTQRLLFDQRKLTEGPMVDAQGNLYFSDQPNDVIRRISIYGAAGEGEGAEVYVIDPDEKKLLTFYAFPEKVYNVCFGGETDQTLYVCSGGSVYQLLAEAKGIVLPIQ